MLEDWNCIEKSCTSRFIRRDYLFNHLTGRKHKYSKEDARRKAIAARRGDIHHHSQFYEDISEDDSVFDLIAGVENTNYGGTFDIDNYLDENENVLADDRDMMIFLSKIIEYEDISEDDTHDYVQDSCGNHSKTISDNECEDSCNEQTFHSDDDMIIISHDEDNFETTVEISTSIFKTQTLILTLTRTVQMINGQEVATNVSCEQDFYEYFD